MKWRRGKDRKCRQNKTISIFCRSVVLFSLVIFDSYVAQIPRDNESNVHETLKSIWCKLLKYWFLWWQLFGWYSFCLPPLLRNIKGFDWSMLRIMFLTWLLPRARHFLVYLELCISIYLSICRIFRLLWLLLLCTNYNN